jgi:hypothetical protein
MAVEANRVRVEPEDPDSDIANILAEIIESNPHVNSLEYVRIADDAIINAPELRAILCQFWMDEGLAGIQMLVLMARDYHEYGILDEEVSEQIERIFVDGNPYK